VIRFSSQSGRYNPHELALNPGARLGPYKILSAIGAGGMGEVYRARDTRMERPVAIKILPSQAASDSQLRERFDREVKVLAALSHPNIVAIYDVGTLDGIPYAAMELLDGATLRERTAGAPLPLRTAVDYAVQIGRGLAAAHDKGIDGTLRERPKTAVFGGAEGTWAFHANATVNKGRPNEGRAVLVDVDASLRGGGDRKPYRIFSDPGQQDEARVSPNGRWLAYTDLATGRPEVHVQSLVTKGAKWRVSNAGGRWPRWRSDGTELFYLAAGGKLTAVPVQPDTTSFHAGVHEPLFQTGHSVLAPGLSAFNVSPNGQRFLITTAGDENQTASIVVVTNWPAAMKP
jgi:Protein kinase domain